MNTNNVEKLKRETKEIIEEKDMMIEELNRQVEEMERILHDKKLSNNKKKERLHEEIIDVSNEIENYQKESISEIENLKEKQKKEINDLKEQYKKEIQKTKQNSQLEAEINLRKSNMQKQNTLKNLIYQRQIEELNTELKSIKRTNEKLSKEIQNIKENEMTKNDSKQGNQNYGKSLTKIDLEIVRLYDENKDLMEELKRYDKIIYHNPTKK